MASRRTAVLSLEIGQLAARGIVVLAGSLLVLLLGLPLAALVIRVPPATLLARLGQPEVLEALRLSLFTSACSTAAVVLLGLPVAHLLATREFRGKRLLELLIDVPMVLPPTVAGVGLLLAFGRAGLAGGVLRMFGLSLPFTTLAVIVAQLYVATPFFVSSATAGFLSVEPRYLESAATHRASPFYTFLHVTLPLSAPSLLAGAAMGWARALGEFGATITFAGNLPGRTQTMPLAVYVALQSDVDAAVTLSVLLLAVSLVILLGLRVLPGVTITRGILAFRRGR